MKIRRPADVCITSRSVKGQQQFYLGQELVGVFSHRNSSYHAEALILERKIVAERLGKTRNCIRCDKQFLSEGPHHRMCDDCRAKGDSI